MVGFTPSAADHALRYGRGRGGLAYDDILIRTQAAFPAAPAYSLRTRSMARREREQDAAHRRDADIDMLIAQIETLRHRSLDLPKMTDDLSFRFEAGEQHITFFIARDPEGQEDAWTFSLAHPPGLVMRDTFEIPAHIATQRYRLDFPGVLWLPLSVVIARGAFPHFQDARASLSRPTQPGCMYLFVSHRWLATHTPDPECIQARFFAWQLLASLAEALEIAHDRGLHQPRPASAAP